MDPVFFKIGELNYFLSVLSDSTQDVVFYSSFGNTRGPAGLDSSMGSSSSELDTTLGEVRISSSEL